MRKNLILAFGAVFFMVAHALLYFITTGLVMSLYRYRGGLFYLLLAIDLAIWGFVYYWVSAFILNHFVKFETMGQTFNDWYDQLCDEMVKLGYGRLPDRDRAQVFYNNRYAISDAVERLKTEMGDPGDVEID